ncbi:DUF6443 domain-containing protein [Marinoscillum sp. 108]|uniref:DUF6443 domain-containing protein n=1 Tax=Marinoscillum sp. 108 TaxID=2653151 RepID=UPI0012F26B78|nr:DUF6443 domain-containing protein [Marinoscillum sp. 108]VXD14833.1 conserved exported hypothetical protein [Marinoscillum sp. 108]
MYKYITSLFILTLFFSSVLKAQTYDDYHQEYSLSTFLNTVPAGYTGGLTIDISDNYLTVSIVAQPASTPKALSVKQGQIVLINSVPAVTLKGLGAFGDYFVDIDASGYLTIDTEVMGTIAKVFSINETYGLELGFSAYPVFTSTENYVATSTMINAVTTSNVKSNDRMIGVTYFDGLGRPVQTSSLFASNDGYDLITPITYDAKGRQDTEYMPYPDNLFGAYSNARVADQLSYYGSPSEGVQSTGAPFAKTIFEDSPLDRPRKQGSPGAPWQPTTNPDDLSDHSRKMSYRSNVAADNVRKYLWSDIAGEMDDAGFYGDNTLFVSVIYDEDNHLVHQFTDRKGQVILKRVFDGASGLDTYYIFDNRGNLRRVLPPMASAGLLSPTPPATTYTNFSATWNYTSFVQNSGSGGGAVDVAITNNILTMDFSAGFSSNTLKSGNTVHLNTKRIPDMTLGTICDGKYTVKVTNNYIVIDHTPGGSVTGFDASFSVDIAELSRQYVYNEDLAVNSYDGRSYEIVKGSVTLLPGFNFTATTDETFSVGLSDGTSAGALNYLYGFEYNYDQRNRLIGKKVPGADWVHMVYDKRDRLILTQDGNQRLSNQWTFTKYDHLNRPVLSGVTTISGGRQSVQDAVDTFYQGSAPLYESRGSTIHGYTNSSYPVDSDPFHYYSVTYYDDYAFGIPSGYEYAKPADFNITKTDRVKGQVTATKTKVLGVTAYHWSLNYYDAKYRVIQSVSANYVGGQDRITTQYKHIGWVEKTRRVHTGGESVTIDDRFAYDSQGRLLKQYQTINSDPEVLLAQNRYNDLGQVIEKNIGQEGTGAPAQSVDYRYNTRGWLTTVNGGTTFDDANDRFGMELKYDGAPTGYKQYNGNIGQMLWKTTGGGQNANSQNYKFGYDDLSRLTAATYNSSSKTNYYNVSGISYDLNGNIQTLVRKFNNSNADNLDYDYYGNQLTSVGDTSDNSLFDEEFSEGNQPNEYLYDQSGNMISDANKAISNISYNYLNLPEQVVVPEGTIYYTYNAQGVKLRKFFDKTSGIDETTDYVGGIQYKNGALDFIQHGEGRAVKNGAGFDYKYNLTDHLGNVRVTVDAAGVVIQRDDYYPFGLTFNSFKDGSDNKYLYNQGTGEKTFATERQPELGLDMTKFRMYDYALGRFTSIDPKAEQAGQESWTPYHFGFNNPILQNDPYGDCPVCVNYFISSASALYVKYSGIVSNVRAPVQRSINGTSGVPSHVNMDDRSRFVTNTASTWSDANQVATNAKKLGVEVTKDWGEALDKTGDAISNAGLASTPVTGPVGLSVMKVGDAISATGKVTKAVANAVDGDYEQAGVELTKAGISAVSGSLVGNMVDASKLVGNAAKNDIVQETILQTVNKVGNTASNAVIDEQVKKQEDERE